MPPALRGLLARTRPYWTRYAVGMSSLLGTNGCDVASTFLVRYAVDEASGLPDAGRVPDLARRVAERAGCHVLWVFAAAFLGTIVVQGAFRYLWRWGIMMSSQAVGRDLRRRLFERVLAQEQGWFDRTPSGEILAVSASDVEAIRMFLGLGLLLGVDAIVYFLILPVVMLQVDWRLTLVLVVPLPILPVVTHRLGQSIHHQFERCQEQVARVAARAQEGIAGMKVVQAFVQSANEIAGFERVSRDSRDRFVRLARDQSLFQPLLAFLVSVEVFLVMWFGGAAVLDGSMRPGALFQILILAMMLTVPMREVGWTLSLYQRAAASLGRFEAIARRRPRIADESSGPPPARDSRLEFRGLTFTHPGAAAPSLRGIDLAIEPGRTVALVGPVGAGKSALLSLIPRFHQAPEGQVLVGGVDVRRWPLAALRRSIGYVSQHVFLFSASIAENVALGRPEANRAEVERAARVAGLAADLARFPAGLDTPLGERGVNLSGGQRQRVAIARAILVDPTWLVLDDCLSQVDAATEEEILAGLAEVRRSRTCLVVAHRLSTVRHADEIVVLAEGRIVERGTHATLVRSGGWYARTWEEQFLAGTVV